MKVNSWTAIAYDAHKVALNGGELKYPIQYNIGLLNASTDDTKKPEGFTMSVSHHPEVGILMSGGLDSIACYLMAKKEYENVKCFYYDIGQPYKEKELKAIKEVISEELIIISDYKLSGKGDKYDWGDVVLPLRNMILIFDIAERIHGGKVYFGVVDGELKEHGGGDKGRPFIEEMTRVLKTLPFPVELVMPLCDKTKGNIVKWYLDNGFQKELHLTMSCLTEEEGHCGKCKSCFKKGLAFLYNGEVLKTNSDIRERTDLIELYGNRTVTNNLSKTYIDEMRLSITLLN